jgi:ubiquinone/menaquinone biosynthesis C-methylase UbiE
MCSISCPVDLDTRKLQAAVSDMYSRVAREDVVISNAVLNLAHDERVAFAEALRVLRPGGRLQIADIVVKDELSDAIRGRRRPGTSRCGG